jgi:hypothetical protein
MRNNTLAYLHVAFLYRKRENSAEPVATANRRGLIPRLEAPSNGKLNGSSPIDNELYDGNSSKSDDYRDCDEQENEELDRRYLLACVVNPYPTEMQWDPNVSFFWVTATDGGKDLRDTHKILLRMSQILTRTLTVMMISWERLCMMKNI